ncbi:hypothetical protein [Baaleninema sp.]|uniref:hypothetical protein n=1 Tax=Baaleninema sp. TaxID=3101197 RepID=UPI003D06EFF1
MNTNFNSQLNSEEIKTLISQFSADDVLELKESLEDWLESTATVSSEEAGLSELGEGEQVS